MRVGLIIYGSLDTTSGGYLYDRQLVSYLRQAGDRVEVISLPWTRYGRHLLQNFDPVLHQLSTAPFDLLLQDELNHPSLFWLNRRLRREASFPLVSIVHHLRSSERHFPLLRPFYRVIESAYLRSVAGFVFNSKTTLAAVTSLSGKEKPYVVAYPAADHSRTPVTPARVRERAREPGPLRLIFVGNVIPRKGCQTLIQALADLPAGSWQLKIIGSMTAASSYVRQMKVQAYTSGIAPYIHWHGPLSDADRGTLLSDSHLLVVPSSYEGFGIVYLEGMNAGLPAIATTAGAAHEIVDDEVNGYLIPPGDAISLARRIQSLVEDRELLSRLGVNALDRARRHPTWEAAMSSVRQFLVRLAA